MSSAGGDVAPGWKLVHIGFEGDDVDVAGVNPWSLGSWGASIGTITVAHPAYPMQRHQMWVYRLAGPSGAPVEFAAGEFSNGVWGIFERDQSGGMTS